MIVEDSTVSNNHASADGGGVFAWSPSGGAASVVAGFNEFSRTDEWQNYSPLVGAGNVSIDNWLMNMGEPGYAALFASASSNAPHHHSINIPNGIDFGPEEDYLDPQGNPVDGTGTAFIASRETDTVFHSLLASYMVEWNKGNNIMRALLANDGYGLTAQWNPPNTFDGQLLLQHMGLGETIGYANLITENGYTAANLVETWHGLLGDPTLRMHAVKPASNVMTSGGAGNVTISWSASPVDNVNGGADPSLNFIAYNVYRSPTVDGDFVFVGSTTDLSINDTLGSPTDVYMVRAVERDEGPSGTYINASEGIFS